ncbi:Na+/H+ antiporter subunit E [Shouchella lehensis]|uniref:Antiporter subunit mnhE2 n=2 Tax=Shouchella lehensis TaxID=300825 RepID=A0A060M192_9BACI|nr:Na+/H+ antiporter subunit E [Shouchella lehensis]AIC95795.1 antiporter subunit mnhE2 [Shouchella lehensis G1]MBG9784774.1 monovalent cation/H+ antiporter subunit E [Shouchella lehensis]RQW18459.1 Na+/H+ antiporter subunit E [Bacillus sp. C1-1]TES46179.1 Na+/H+ antiporter subunit E [Shouchella lehensis]
MFGQLLLNILIAFLWVLLQDEDTFEFSTFFGGFLIGLGIIYVMRRFFFKEFYLKRAYSAFKLLLIFNRELISSSVLIIRQILSPKLKVTPGIFTYETKLKGDWEITALSLLLMLTPGSVVIEISPSNNVFYIHAMDVPESKNAVLRALTKFEKAIMEVTR